MPERYTTKNDEVPFGPDDFKEVFSEGGVIKYVTNPEWTIMCERWSISYTKKHRKPLEQFCRGKLPGDALEKDLTDARHAVRGGRRGPVTVSSNAKLVKFAARALLVRYQMANPDASMEDANRHVIEALETWLSKKSVYRYLKRQDPPPAPESHP